MMSLSEKMIYDIVVALSAHYDIRDHAIAEKSVSPRVRMEYMYINSKMLDAAVEIAGARYARQFIFDIGHGVGYAKSKIDSFSESNYKKSKMAVKRRIAEKLHLLDAEGEFNSENKK